MEVSDEEWEKMKESREQFDDRIVECTWDSAAQTWRIMRIRDDKPHANHKSILDKILISIQDGVEVDEVSCIPLLPSFTVSLCFSLDYVGQ